uniref:Uncharacterized protein n=1 Tax=Biomphalaria glabrata TaxID=6526 RepID=A0A2C9KE39_BIOGL
MNHWKQAFYFVFGKKCLKRWKSAAVDLQLVDNEIKASCLFDLWLASPKDMLVLIRHLHNTGLIQGSLGVASLGSDIIIYNAASLDSFIKSSLQKTSFIDISSKLQLPGLVSEGKVEKTFDTFLSFVQNTSQSSDAPTLHNIEQSTDLNGPCLFGLFLGYPCVYWYDSCADDGNCLTDQHLVLFQVVGHLSRSFTDPTSCRTHTIFSFTVPFNLIDELRPKVDNWFQKWEQNEKWKNMFSEVLLNSETVSPQVVCL